MSTEYEECQKSSHDWIVEANNARINLFTRGFIREFEKEHEMHIITEILALILSILIDLNKWKFDFLQLLCTGNNKSFDEHQDLINYHDQTGIHLCSGMYGKWR